MLSLNSEQLRQIEEHSQATYPEECGGLLLGHKQGDQRLVVEVLPLQNRHPGSRLRRIDLDPLDYLQAEKRAASLGLGVWGFYHSHPDRPALPSPFDLEQASGLEWSYLIIPVCQGRAGTARSWVLAPDRLNFVEETVERNSS